ncbi:MAG: glycosyltransferase family 4 protein [Sphingobacteriales bacterium]|nr:glycosyltransferase family 4 protein [Sphingobacteriales bacterium]
MWNKITKNDLVYVNTVLPFGAALLGKIKGAKVIYHIHESSVSPAVLKWFLFGMVRFTATEIINVSKYVQQQHNICSVPNRIVYNTIEDSYLEKLLPKKPTEQAQNVLMICSLKVYKGVFEFLQLAKDNPQFYFRLVLNAKQEDINDFFRNCVIPDNLLIYPAQQDVHIFYQWADIIVNLSRPDGWIETFGLTIIEGMAYRLPAVVPPVGGILEVIEEGVSGCSVDSRNRQQLNETLRYILQNNNRYQMMSEAAKKRLELFKEAKMRAVLSYSTLIN